VGGAIGAKAAASVATAALLTAGAVEVNNLSSTDGPAPQATASQQVAPAEDPKPQRHEAAKSNEDEKPAAAATTAEAPAAEPDLAATETTEAPTAPTTAPQTEPPAGGSGGGSAGASGFGPVTGQVGGNTVGSYTFTSGDVEEAPAEELSEAPPVEEEPPPPSDPSGR
jgi:hypothetical protein